MSRFQISYWSHTDTWRPFTAPVEAASAREAIERVGPRAAGRYRVTAVETRETVGLFRITLSSHDECELIEVSRFRVM